MLQIALLREIVSARDRHHELFIDLEHKLKRLQRTDSFLPPQMPAPLCEVQKHAFF